MGKKEAKSVYVCDNCQYRTTDESKMIPLVQVHHLWERLEGGSVTPNGACPRKDCGALMYEETRMLVLTGGGDDPVHGVVEVTGLSQSEFNRIVDVASDRYNQDLVERSPDRYVHGADGLRKWLRKKNGGQ